MRHSTKYWRRYRELLQDRFILLPFDAKVATTFARLSADLSHLGTKRPALDLMIGATAAHHGLVVATLNARHFVGIPGVVVEDWGAQLPQCSQSRHRLAMRMHSASRPAGLAHEHVARAAPNVLLTVSSCNHPG